MVAVGSGSKDDIHIIPLVPHVGVWSPPWSGVPQRLEMPLILALSNPTASEAREWDYSFSSNSWSLQQPLKQPLVRNRRAATSCLRQQPLRSCSNPSWFFASSLDEAGIAFSMTQDR